jgi:nitrite reductase/ring-hydroxylating ferredoxin subunit
MHVPVYLLHGSHDSVIPPSETDWAAFELDSQPHEAVPLEQGVQDGSVLTCLEHLWQFDLHTGAPMGDAEVGLTGYRLKEEAGDLYVELKG